MSTTASDLHIVENLFQNKAAGIVGKTFNILCNPLEICEWPLAREKGRLGTGTGSVNGTG